MHNQVAQSLIWIAPAAKAHMALYVNFDADKATIRADGKPTVDQIATLMKKDAALKLALEGHTHDTHEGNNGKAHDFMMDPGSIDQG